MYNYLLILLSALLLTNATLSAQNKLYEKKEISELNEKANRYLTELQFKESLLFSREALKRAISIKDDYLIATAYNTIAGNYDEISENDKAIGNYKKALFFATRSKNDTLIGFLNNNLGNMYFFEKKEYKRGLDYYEKALSIAEKTTDTARMAFTRLNVALAYFEVGDYDKGYPHLQFINQQHAKYGDPTNTVYLHMLNGVYYGNKNQYDVAETYFQKAIGLAKVSKLDLDLAYTYQEYSKFLKKKGDYESAYNYFDLYDKLKDSIYDKTKLKSAEVEGINLELDEYKRAVQRIEAEKEIQAMSLQKSEII
ncbi:MAG TPA: tetratricopeptide repeat protein, partial [Flavobacterium sp.]|nr:tetratricopeptide repeat protein [Flavobacterium sp.]